MAGAPPPEYAATSSILRGSAVSESAVAFASIAANEKNARDRTRTPELNRELHGKSQSGQLRNPDQAQVVGAMAIQAWYRAARARAVAVGDRLPETVDASGLVRALPRAPPPLLPSRAPPPRASRASPSPPWAQQRLKSMIAALVWSAATVRQTAEDHHDAAAADRADAGPSAERSP